MRSVSTRNRRGIETEVRALRTRVMVAQEEVSGQFQLGVEREEAQRKLAETEQALEAMRAERDDLEKEFICSARRSFRKIKKELGESTIALKAKEKEFADLKSFYEENNASNLNEEERLKLELNEAKTTLGEANEKIAQLELDARTVSNERYDLIAQIDQYKKQMGDSKIFRRAQIGRRLTSRREGYTYRQNQHFGERVRANTVQNEKIAKDLEENDQTEERAIGEGSKSRKKRQVYSSRSRRDEENARRQGARVDRFTTTNRHVSEATTKCRTNTRTTRYE